MAIGIIKTKRHIMEGIGVTKPNLGIKRTCESCEARFFDFNKNPATCPKCHSKNKIATNKGRRAATGKSKATSVKTSEVETPAEASNVEETETELDTVDADEGSDEEETEIEDDLSESLIEDTTELDEENDELSKALKHIDGDIADK
jgi:uncharacterized protein (TIGR02300 family)